MCKLGDKDYWQVGDEVYCTSYGKGKVVCVSKYSGEVRVESQFLSTIIADDYTKTGQHSHSRTRTTLFHIGAITFDEQDRPIAINYDYVPDRTPKVKVTKLPHEFDQDEQILAVFDNYNDTSKNIWEKCVFMNYDQEYNEIYTSKGLNALRVIPYKGNEHCEGKSTNCKSGKVPDDYVFPKPEHVFKPFDRVLVRNWEDDKWEVNLFSRTRKADNYRYSCINSNWIYCIPFEGNEKLLGTTNSPEE